MTSPIEPKQTGQGSSQDDSMLKAQGHEADNRGEISDGYHTFNELYDHRIALFIALMFAYPERSWFSPYHEDGTMFDGWFIAGMHLPTGDITYHLPNVPYFNQIGANKQIHYLHFAPKWDGHSPADVVKRLQYWVSDMAKNDSEASDD